MTDFIFLISTQELAATGLFIAFLLVCAVALVVATGIAFDMIDNYNDGIDNWHMEDDDARKRD